MPAHTLKGRRLLQVREDFANKRQNHRFVSLPATASTPNGIGTQTLERGRRNRLLAYNRPETVTCLPATVTFEEVTKRALPTSATEPALPIARSVSET